MMSAVRSVRLYPETAISTSNDRGVATGASNFRTDRIHSLSGCHCSYDLEQPHIARDGGKDHDVIVRGAGYQCKEPVIR